MHFDRERPWLRQPFDSDLSWALFSEFLFLPPPRRIADLAKRPGCPLTWAQIEDLAFSDGWKIRAEHWDRHLENLRRQTVEQVVQEDARTRAERQGRLGAKLQRLADIEAGKFLEQALRDPSALGVLGIRDVIRAAVVGVRIERLALGETTEKIETVPDLSNWSIEDLRALRELQEKAGTTRG